MPLRIAISPTTLSTSRGTTRRWGRGGVAAEGSLNHVEGRGGAAAEKSPNHVVAIRSRNHVEGRRGAEEGSAARVGGLAAMAQ
jgi:hypothetical protein